jgi:hypothetical protein
MEGEANMPSGKTKERQAARKQEIDAIGPKDAERLHKGMNKSRTGAKKAANKQPNLSTGKRDGDPSGSTSRTRTSTSGSKRRASAGAGPGERSTTTAVRQSRRSTAVNPEKSLAKPPRSERGTTATSRTRRNDLRTRNNEKPMKGSKDRAKHFT